MQLSRCHTENLSYENILITFKYTLFFFHAFIFSGTNIKGRIFSRRVPSHPSHPPQLRAWKHAWFFTDMCQNRIFIGRIMFLQIEIEFIKWEQNDRWPDGTYHIFSNKPHVRLFDF